jgi:hypothetical protein
MNVTHKSQVTVKWESIEDIIYSFKANHYDYVKYVTKKIILADILVILSLEGMTNVYINIIVVVYIIFKDYTSY